MSKAMKIFIVVMIAHWIEHIVQAYQVWALRMPRQCAMGVLGMYAPVLVTGEWLHFGFAFLTLAFIAATRPEFRDTAGRWWNAAVTFSVFHFIEHLALFFQAQTGRFWFGRSVPTSFIQVFFPRIELHLFYNSVVTVLVSVAMYYRYRQPKHGSDCMICGGGI